MVKWSPYSGAIRFLRGRGLIGKHPTEVMRAFENLIRGEAGVPLETRTIMPLEKSVGKITEQVQEGAERFGLGGVGAKVGSVVKKVLKR